MAINVLQELENDVVRLLIAGSAMAASDEGLTARRQSLATLAAKIPALTKLSEQIDKICNADTSMHAAELLNLSAMVEQVRGAQAQTQPLTGELREIPATVPIDTPLNSNEIVPIYQAITTRGEGRSTIVHRAIDHQLVVDLRLFYYWLAAINDPSQLISEPVEKNIIPQFGEAAYLPLKQAFDIKGGQADGLRLICLARFNKPEINDLILKAVEKGSPSVSAEALKLLAEIDYQRAEVLAQQFLSSNKNAQLRSAASAVLERSESDETLNIIIDAIANNGVDYLIRQLLNNSKHSNATARLLELLTPEALKTGDEKTLMVFQIIAVRRDKTALPKLIECWQSNYDARLRTEAGQAIMSCNDPSTLEKLAMNINDKSATVRKIAIKSAALVDADRGLTRFLPFFDPNKMLTEDGFDDAALAIQQYCEKIHDNDRVDDRFLNCCLAILEKEAAWKPYIKTPKVFWVVRGMLNYIFRELGRAQDARILPAMERMLDKIDTNDNYIIYTIFACMSYFRDKSFAPVVEKWAREAELNANALNAVNTLLQQWSAEKIS